MRKIKLFSLLAVLLVTCFTSTAWAWSGSGTENDPYLISSVADWNTLSTNSQSNTYAGVYFRLMNDLSVGTMIGKESNETGRFAGIFDGNGHKLTVSYNVTESNCAPFQSANNATIKNLIVDGSITTNQKFATGMIAMARGTTSIENCRVSVQITDNTGGDGTDGGFVGKNVSGTLAITGCVFDGIFNGPNVRGWGGFVGWNESNGGGTTTITNCLFAPASASFDATDCQTFSRSRDLAAVTLNNCYYTLALAGTQGTQVYSPKAIYGATMEMAGTPTATYNVSRLNMYSAGLACGSKLYAPANATLSVNLSGSDAGFVVRPNTDATLSGSSNPYSLQIGSQNTQVAPNKPSATVDGTGYVFMEDAVNAWGNNQTLQLLADVPISNRISIVNTRTCDLNGHGIIQEGDYEIFEVKNGGNLTLMDSNTGNLTHKFVTDANGIATLDEANGTVVVNGGYLTGGKGNNYENGGIAEQGRNGGAIFVYNGTLTMNGGTIIGNKAVRHAGGVFVCKNSLFTFNGGTITRNQGYYAGGVDVYNSTADITDNEPSTMRMTGGTISYNYGTYHTGGLAINSDDGAVTVEITGGSIVNNHSAANRAGGLFVEHTQANLRISGNPVIKDNYSDANPLAQHNIRLNKGKITIIGALTNTEKIGVTMTTPGEFTTDLSAYGNASNFSSDDPTYGVIINSNNEAQLATPATLSDAPTAISNLEYDGNAQALVNGGTAVNGTMAYSLDGTNWSASIPTGTNAGTYTVYYMVQGDATHADYIPANNTIEVTIAKVAPVATAPTAKDDLVSTGEPQALVNAGTSEHGVWWYNVNNGEYTTYVPARTDAGDYTVYYKFIGDANHTDIEEASCNVSIAAAIPVADLSKNIAIDLRGNQLGGDGSTGGSKYLIIDSEDNYTYVDDEPAAYNAYFAFENFNGSQHGYYNLLVTAPVTAGNYLLTLGGCQYGNGGGNVKNAASEILASFDQKTAGCYDADPVNNSVYLIFTVDAAQTITIDCGNYTPYIALKKMPVIPTFSDFEINFQSDPYNVISGAKPAGTVIAGSFHDGQHGYQNVEATVPTQAGTYRLTLGACQYGNGEGNVMSETNIELASFNQNLGENKCYVASTGANTVSVTFAVDIDQTITIDCGTYTPYMKLEKITAYAVEFALGDAEGTAPAAVDVTIGEALTMPVNKTMYKEGYTLTGWSDGANTYAIGAAFTPATDVILTPVFTANEADLLNADVDVTVRWNFGTSLDAPAIHAEGSNAIIVAQALIGDKTVDVKLAIDATSGKFQNDNRTDEWAQVNIGTIFTFPSKVDAVVTVNTHSGNTTYDLAAGTLTCNTNDYYSYLEVTYPAPAPVVPTFIVVGANEDPEHAGDYYATFYDSSNRYALPDNGTKAYVAELSGTDLLLHEIASGAEVIPANTAVIFKAPSSSISLTLSDNDAVTVTDPNCLVGTDVAKAAPANCYVISGHSSDNSVTGVGFYQYTGTLKPNKAYTIYSGSVAYAPKRLRFVFDSPTGVDIVDANSKAEKRIENGQVIIIRNGVRYNAAGQIVK